MSSSSRARPNWKEGWRQYEAAAGLLAGVQAQLAGFKNLGDILDSEEENARYELRPCLHLTGRWQPMTEP